MSRHADYNDKLFTSDSNVFLMYLFLYYWSPAYGTQ